MLQKTIKYSNPHQKVLKPAIDEINTKSDLWVSEPEIIGKKWKKITDIRLYFGNKNEKISDDFTKELIKQYNKFKSFTIFSGCYYLREGENLPLSEMVKITRIGTDKSTGFLLHIMGIALINIQSLQVQIKIIF